MSFSLTTVVLFLAAPVANAENTAPVLPNGWTMYSIECDWHSLDSTTGQLSTVNVATGVTTPVGNPATNGNTNSSVCAHQGTFDATTNTSYFVDVNNGGGYSLATANLVTGSFTNLDVNFGSSIQCGVTSDTAGTLYGNLGRKLASVNASTGALTAIGTNATQFADCAVAVNPVDDQIYTFIRNSSNRLEIAVFNKTTGALSPTGRIVDESATGLNHVVPLSYITSMAIDSNGIAWLLDDAQGINGGGLVAVNLATGTAWPMTNGLYNLSRFGTSVGPNGLYYSTSIWLKSPVAPAPAPNPAPNGDGSNTALASTGSNSLWLTAAGVSAIVVGIGVWRIRRRRTSA